uniref:DUF4585 domain-containing protein n=1 Tax=Myripristis murdjan TaxID=586833 RepID=A0A668AKI5_9TELE
MPIARSYPESLLSTRQLQQQQSLIRVQNSQQDTRVGGPTKWLQPAGPPNKNTAPGRVATNRPRQSSSSSMGSELDEADNEVKWFTDLAFRSLSSPEVDYLDMYNSSHCSSTNISQPSTQESPAGASAAWLAYADFKGSAPKLDNEDSSFQQPPTYISDGLDPSKRYEMGSFECVDVAVEREDSRRGRRGVPKRQIQLKRKNTAEIKQDEGSEDSCPGVPVMMGSPSLQRHSRETLVRQHSTPAAVHESYHPELSPDLDEKNERKSKLQKSVSLDETCTKTKMATCLIKSVLSKKMQSVDKQTEEHAREGASSPSKDKSLPIEIENVEAPCKEFPKLDTHNLSSSLHSDHSLSSEDLAMRREPSTKGEVRLQKNFGVKSNNRPSSNSSNTSFNLPQSDSEGIDSPCRNTVSSRSEMRSELTVPFDSKQSTTEKIILKTGGKQGDDSKRWEENEAGDSAHATAGNTGAHFATEASSTQVRMTNRDGECEVLGTEDDKQLQQGDNKSTYMSKTPEITLKASPAMKRKKKTSLSVSLAPEVENKPEPQHEAPSPEMCFRQTEESAEARVDRKTEEEQDNENNKSKAPIHKVRDVRRLVKNTYNLSFKATSVAKPSDENEGRTENSQEDRREEIKEERKVDIRVEKREGKQEGRREEKREDMAEEKKEEKREERTEELRVESKEEQRLEVRDANVLTLSPVLQSKGKPPPGVSGSPYNDPGHSHSPNLPSMDPQYLCGPQSLGPSYGSEYGADSSSLYSESSYGQTPRRVLMDPETGKYFYIEVPMQPLRKMLFDPETGQYVEVLIPQQAMSHSGLYPPSYLPYAAPPPPPHPQGPPQPTRHPEASSYLEGMYYVPTGMNASPNPTPPDCYHKHPPNLPSAGGKSSSI